MLIAGQSFSGHNLRDGHNLRTDIYGGFYLSLALGQDLCIQGKIRLIRNIGVLIAIRHGQDTMPN